MNEQSPHDKEVHDRIVKRLELEQKNCHLIEAIYPGFSEFMQYGRYPEGRRSICVVLDPTDQMDVAHFVAIRNAYKNAGKENSIPIACEVRSSLGWQTSAVLWLYRSCTIRESSLADAANHFQEYTQALQHTWIDDLEQKYPWFPKEVGCSSGWKDLIIQLCQDIQAFLDSHQPHAKDFNVRVIKQKYGRLEFYVTPYPAPDEITKLIGTAGDKSETICEACGAPGRSGEEGNWMCVKCLKCQSPDFTAYNKQA